MLWAEIIMLIWKMHLYMTCLYKHILLLRTNWWNSLVLVDKIVQTLEEYRNIYNLLSRWANSTWHTCSSTSCSTRYRKWLQLIMHWRNEFITFQYVYSLIVKQISRYSYKGRPSNCIGQQVYYFIDNNGKDTKHTRQISIKYIF